MMITGGYQVLVTIVGALGWVFLVVSSQLEGKSVILGVLLT